ncbi:sentrin-specific protease 1-like isoform X1 [Labeo rohita]|uniref:Sentrin-specific protease 1-like isoform X1 n=1 Tax=Labeo rohita TaxID=84645 RepID=A0A498M8W4_LABRO|nr:sentrin-specific protease 1-like isoform X1 [Labeo rohita]
MILAQDTSVKEAWNGKKGYILLAKVGTFKVYFADIHRTAPDMELESEVMTAYMHLLVKNFNKESQGRAIAIDTFEMSSIWKQKRAKVKLHPLDYRYILGIINACNHWTLTHFFTD